LACFSIISCYIVIDIVVVVIVINIISIIFISTSANGSRIVNDNLIWL